MTFTGKYVYIWLTISSCYGSIPLTLRLMGRDAGLSALCHCRLQVRLSAEGAKNVSWPWLPLLRGWGSLTMAFTGKFVYIWLTISSCYCSIPLALGLMGRDASLSTLCHGCGFVCQQRVLKAFPGSGSLHSEDEVLWLWHLVVNLYRYIYRYIYICIYIYICWYIYILMRNMSYNKSVRYLCRAIY